MSDKSVVGVIGGGSWATAIVKLLQNNVEEIAWFMRNEDAISFIKKHHHNPNYITAAELDISRLYLSSNILIVSFSFTSITSLIGPYSLKDAKNFTVIEILDSLIFLLCKVPFI